MNTTTNTQPNTTAPATSQPMQDSNTTSVCQKAHPNPDRAHPEARRREAGGEHSGRGQAINSEQRRQPRRSRNNPKPRAERLTGTYHGKPEDFEKASPVVTPKLARIITQVLAMTDDKRAKRYSGDLRLYKYSHKTYRWFATLGKRVTGVPIRRFFSDRRSAITWLELVRDRRQRNNLRGNIPMVGVSRDGFSMSWEAARPQPSPGDERLRTFAAPDEGQPIRPNGEGSSASAAGTWNLGSRRSGASSRRDERVRSCATSNQILGEFSHTSDQSRADNNTSPR